MTTKSKKVKAIKKSSSKDKSKKEPRVLELQPTKITEKSAWPEIHEDAFPSTVGKFVNGICEDSEADRVVGLVYVLTRLGLEFCGTIYSDGYEKHSTLINTAIITDSTGYGMGMYELPVEQLLSGLVGRTLRIQSTLSSGEDIVRSLTDKSQETDRKSRASLDNELGANGKRLLINDPDLSAALKTFSKSELITFPKVIRGLAGNGNVELSTKEGIIKATGAHVAIVTHTASDKISSLLKEIKSTSCLFNCFLWVPESRQKQVAMPKVMPDEVMKEFQIKFGKRIEAAKRLKSVKMSKDAQKLWAVYYPSLTMHYTGIVAAAVNNSKAHVLRLALIYALASGHTEIKARDLKAAIALVKYSNESVLRIFKAYPDNKYKEKLLEALRSAPDNMLSRTAINTKVFGRNTSSEEIDKIIGEMETLNQIAIEPKTTKGAHKGMIKLVPAKSVSTKLYN